MFLVGVTHGFAGTASVMVIIPIAITQSLSDAALYLLLFGVGTIFAMSLFAYAIGQLTKHLDPARALPVFQTVSGILSIGVGIVWIGEKIL